GLRASLLPAGRRTSVRAPAGVGVAVRAASGARRRRGRPLGSLGGPHGRRGRRGCPAADAAGRSHGARAVRRDRGVPPGLITAPGRLRARGPGQRESRGGGRGMLLVMDVGNTNTVLGVYEKTKLLAHWR